VAPTVNQKCKTKVGVQTSNYNRGNATGTTTSMRFYTGFFGVHGDNISTNEFMKQSFQ